MSIKLTFDDAGTPAKEMGELSQFVAKVNEELKKIKVSASSPETIQAGIRQAEACIDSCAACYAGNAFVEKTAAEIKSKYRETLMKKMGEISPQ